MDKKLVIRVSGREQQSPVFRLLGADPTIELEVTPLASADYVLSNTVAVKRKEAADFLASILDRRLFRQAAQLQRDFERVVLMIEGDLHAYSQGLPADLIRSAIAFLAVTKGITVLQLPTAEDTAAMVRALARQAQKGFDHEVSFRAGKTRATDPATVFLVEGLPGIGPRRARQLLEHFGAPAEIMRASREQLIQAPGIGPKRAQRIWDALNTRYTTS